MSWGLKMTIITINTVYHKSAVSGQQNKPIYCHADWVGPHEPLGSRSCYKTHYTLGFLASNHVVIPFII